MPNSVLQRSCHHIGVKITLYYNTKYNSCHLTGFFHELIGLIPGSSLLKLKTMGRRSFDRMKIYLLIMNPDFPRKQMIIWNWKYLWSGISLVDSQFCCILNIQFLSQINQFSFIFDMLCEKIGKIYIPRTYIYPLTTVALLNWNKFSPHL